MVSLKEKLIDWKNRLKDRHMFSIIIVLFSIIVILGLIIYKKQKEYRQASENSYNLAFYEVVENYGGIEVFNENMIDVIVELDYNFIGEITNLSIEEVKRIERELN